MRRSSRPPVAALAWAALALPAGAGAQGWPAKPLRLVVPYAPGGVVDFVARTVGHRLAEQLAQGVIVDNRPGAGGMLGTELAARASPDGYTLLVMDPAIVINPSLQAKVPYDPRRDFAVASVLTSSPLVLAVHARLAAKSVAELVALAKSKPGSLSFASAGVGTTPHMAGEFFRARTRQDIVHVPYKGSGPAMQDLVAGNVQMTFSSITAALPFIREGQLRALATTGAKRSTALADVPTMIEAGFPAFEVDLWLGAFVPAGVPNDLLGRLHAEIGRALLHGEVRTALAKVGAEPVGSPPGAAAAFVRAEFEKWAKLVREAGLKAE